MEKAATAVELEFSATSPSAVHELSPTAAPAASKARRRYSVNHCQAHQRDSADFPTKCDQNLTRRGKKNAKWLIKEAVEEIAWGVMTR